MLVQKLSSLPSLPPAALYPQCFAAEALPIGTVCHLVYLLDLLPSMSWPRVKNRFNLLVEPAGREGRKMFPYQPLKDRGPVSFNTDSAIINR